jgi:hypothetical protein
MNDENYIELPNQYDINKYDIMEEFCDKMDNDELFKAIRGRGTFRWYKDKIIDFGVEKDWYVLKDKALMEIAKEWWRKMR